MIAMFGMVISAGIKMLSYINLQRQENMLIVAISVGMGLGVTVVPIYSHPYQLAYLSLPLQVS